MTVATGRFARYRAGLPYFARVVVSVEVNGTTSDVTFDCERPDFWEGHPCESWKAGAREGGLFALRTVGATARIVVVRICGMYTDSNPSTVAMAAALAVWQAISVTPPPSAIERLEGIVFGSYARGMDEVPNLG